MAATIIPFTYESATDVRVLSIGGEPWFVLADLTRALGLARSAAAVSGRLSDDVRQTYPIPDSLGRIQQTTIVSEPGMYEVIIRSDAPAAEPFRRWLTHEVIPQIRKTGNYGMARQLPQNFAEALRELACEVEAHELAKVRIKELEPAASAWSALVEATGDYSVADAAKQLSRDPAIQIGQNTLFRWLGKHGWLYRRTDEWHPYQEKIDAGLLTLKTNRPYWDSKRGVDVLPAPTVRITAKGLHKLYVLLGGTDALVEVAS